MKALFFDFDGLICDTESAARRSWEELYTRLGHSLPAEVWARMAGRSNGHEVAASDLATRVSRPIATAELAWRSARKLALSNKEPLRPGIADLIGAAQERGLRLAAVSSSGAAWVRPHLARLGILEHLDPVITGDDEPRHKPAPDLYLRALSETGLAAADVVAFEDSSSGVAAATAAGLRCVAIPNGAGGKPADLQQATLVLETLAGFDLGTVPGMSELASESFNTGSRSCSGVDHNGKSA
jgi:HAD superfamily hydrolase (TIGR01509 family)